MNCPSCGKPSLVLDTRTVGGYVRRRRKCETCPEKWSTLEIHIDQARAIVGNEQDFRRDLINATAELSRTVERMRELQSKLAKRRRA